MRSEDWPERLSAYLARASEQGFVWGKNDCLMFAANWMVELCGIDPAHDLRGKYDDAASALRTLKETGAESYEALCHRLIESSGGRNAGPVALHRGDLCIAVNDSVFGVMLGIIADSRAAFLSDNPEMPLLLLPRRKILMGWRLE